MALGCDEPEQLKGIGRSGIFLLSQFVGSPVRHNSKSSMKHADIKIRASLCACLACLAATYTAEYLAGSPHRCARAPCWGPPGDPGPQYDPFILDDLGLEHGS